MKKFVPLLLLTVLTLPAIAQNASLSGAVSDATEHSSLGNATVYLLRRADSVLYRFTRTNKDGSFRLNDIHPGRFVIMISYPKYVTFMDSVELRPSDSRVLPAVNLMTEARLLEEVVVRHTIAPIRANGDTLEFLADSFKTLPGATVEDLLKKFPGFTVDSKGQVTAQGHRIEKVLVDGDEFFGDDPTMATQNLYAKDVAKVQLFDKKSDQATLTGVDDGKRQKTLNLVLKKDAKRGYFGKVEAGSDGKQYYKAKATINKFTSTMKTGAYVSADRTGSNDMTSQESNDLGGVNSNSSSQGNNNGSAGSTGTQGIPDNFMAAAMFNQKFGPRNSFTVNNYSFKRQNTVGDATVRNEYILPDSVYYNNQSQHFNSQQWRHDFHSREWFSLDSLNSVAVDARTSWGHNDQSSVSTTQYLDGNQQLVNTSNSDNSSSTDNNSQLFTINYSRTLSKKIKRSLYLSAIYSNSGNAGDQYVYNEMDYYKSGGVSGLQVVDEKKTSRNTNRGWQGVISYVEPIGKSLSVNVYYRYSWNNAEQDLRSYDKSNGVYDSLNPLYSNHYRFINATNKGGFSLNYHEGKLYWYMALDAQDQHLEQTNLYVDSTLQRNFFNWFPRSQLTWQFSPTHRLSINYAGQTQTPELSQIQPVANNTDPMNIAVGNPGLQPAFIHTLGFNYMNGRQLHQQSWFAWGEYTLTENAFSSRDFTDSLGRRTYQTVNANGNRNYSLSVERYWQPGMLKFVLGIGCNISGNKNNGFVNGLPNATWSRGIGPELSVNKTIENKLEVHAKYLPSYSTSVSSVNPGHTTSYWMQTLTGSIAYLPAPTWKIVSDVETDLRQKMSAGDNGINSTVWNLGLERKLLKRQDLWLNATVNDLLDQKIGLNRNNYSNLITERTFTTVQRYFLLTLRWRFSKK